ncbi:YbdK family carboxylate-amine ligase [Streptomyces sp. WAC07061]|uniref:carboxylate-amine ligase n=1 Tax=Streptomyces sp. WAC07061 TaxID=2487410 RepID=UPI000F7B7377|nr:glutamate--cysteine ligase [Streptomyces sp. WAC07061]RSS40156.1 YbdK family carboxylate-amine ligase [Streptomyces sp. WAC07061]
MSSQAPAPAPDTGGAAVTIGVEEEFFLVDPHTRLVVPAGPAVAARAAREAGDRVTQEFALGQVEGRTRPCRSADELRAELQQVRGALVAAARAEGVRLCASGTAVLQDPGPVQVAGHPRYRAGRLQYRGMMDDFAVSALHVHVHLPDRELAVRSVNHLRPWLPLLIAASANSPYHRGLDTGYASWRTVIRHRFPCLGPPPYAASWREHERLAVTIADTEAMLDARTPFWDLRPNPRLPTLEVRAMDVLQDVGDTVAFAVLLRALVRTAAARGEAGDPGPPWAGEVLRAACWRAARDGWSGDLFHPATGRPCPAGDLARELVDLVRGALEDAGDLDEVTGLFDRLAELGDGASRQRSWAAAGAGPEEVADRLVAATARGTGGDGVSGPRA